MADTASDVCRGRLVDVGDVALWVDDEGPDDSDAVVLLAGADSPGFRWTPTIVEPLVAAGHRVVRFDHRDCGRSSRVDASQPYLLADLADDVVGLLRALGIDAAHMVGRSMGGMVAQLLALDHAAVVRSLTLIGTSGGAGDERLPSPDEALVDAMAERLFSGPPSDDAGRVGWIEDGYRLLSGSLYQFDDELQRELALGEVETGWVPETGHGVAVHGSRSRLDRLGEIVAPTVVVHGTADPVFPVEHGRALAVGIDGAVLIEVDGLGHEVPDPFLVDLVPVLLRHLVAASSFTGG